MPAPGEHKAVQARILHYAQEIGWTFVPRAEAEARRGFQADGPTSPERALGTLLFFNDTLYAQVRKLNPSFAGSKGDVTGRLYALKPDIFGNRELLDYLRGRKTFYYKPEIAPASTFIEIDEHAIARIKENAEGDNTKVINLIKSIEKYADENSDDPLLIGMADRAQQVQLLCESRQECTREALDELLALVEKNEQRKREQAEKGFDGLTYFVYRTLLDAKLGNAEAAAKKIKAAFVAHPNWTASEAELREVRKQVTFAIAAEIDDLDQVAALVAQLFDLLTKAYKLDQ